jgi:hypothetical protein
VWYYSYIMTWRRLNLILFALTAVVGVLRLMTGNIIGAVISLALAAYFGSVAFEFPVIERAKQIWKIMRWRRKSGD